jgi:hypothetical protein
MIFAIFSGLVGTGLSILIRLELAGTNPQILYGNGQLFNVIISVHAIAMIFFMVMPMSVGFFGNIKVCHILYLELNTVGLGLSINILYTGISYIKIIGRVPRNEFGIPRD